MDQQRPAPKVEMNQEKIDQIKKIQKGNGGTGKKAMMILLVLVLVAGAAFAGWYYRDMQAKEAITAKDAEIAQLTQEKANLESQLTEAQEATTSEESETAGPSEEVLEDIQAAIESKNYAALEDYMAEEVTVIKAATECCGAITPTEAVSEVEYLDTATAPWDFAPSEETLAEYADGDYADYFPEGALVGTSKNNFVVAITFDSDDKVDSIFMIVDAKLL